jgi:hypothetical protein
MRKINEKSMLTLQGEVIEICQKDNEKRAKIFFHPGFFEISIDKLPNVHLSDGLIINAEIKIEEIKQKFSIDN